LTAVSSLLDIAKYSGSGINDATLRDDKSIMRRKGKTEARNEETHKENAPTGKIKKRKGNR
jgi:hypothetical protein